MKYPKSLIQCRQCPRLHSQLLQLRKELPDYWNKPVPATGDPDASLIIVGLAPGRHGANRTGIPFTGDASGDLLYHTLNQLGIADQVTITNAVKCLPPDNRPTGEEINNCQPWLREELTRACHRPGPTAILALGTIAHKAVLKSAGHRISAFPFRHGETHELGDNQYLIDSYHCSRYNTQTGRLTPAMFQDAIKQSARIAGLESRRL